MRILVLGGTEFVGRAVVEQALSHGDHVTTFSRGRHPAPLGATNLIGDRTSPGGLAALVDGEWDIVVDTWSAAPSVVRDSAGLLSGRAGHYAYVSSRSVYVYPPAPGLAEGGPVVEASPDAGPGEGHGGADAGYAEAKRGAELAVQRAFGDRALLVRAGLILGPHENVGRLPWWLSRISRGGVVPAPGPPGLGLQLIDARDLARWTLDAAARGLGGPYDLVSPPDFTTMGELLQACCDVTGSAARLRWLTPEQIASSGVSPWIELPLWLPPGPEHDGMHAGDVSKAMAAGLSCRPVRETVEDTWHWLRGLPGDPPQRPDRPRVGLSAEAEARLLSP